MHIFVIVKTEWAPQVAVVHDVHDDERQWLVDRRHRAGARQKFPVRDDPYAQLILLRDGQFSREAMVESVRSVAHAKFLQAGQKPVRPGAQQNLAGILQQHLMLHPLRRVGEVAGPACDMGVTDAVDIALMGGDVGSHLSPDPGKTAEQGSG